MFTILDEKLEICKGKKTGIWIEGRFYQTNEEGNITVPFV